MIREISLCNIRMNILKYAFKLRYQTETQTGRTITVQKQYSSMEEWKAAIIEQIQLTNQII